MKRRTALEYAGILLCLLPILILRDFTPANELKYLSIADEALRQHDDDRNGGKPRPAHSAVHFHRPAAVRRARLRHRRAHAAILAAVQHSRIVDGGGRYLTRSPRRIASPHAESLGTRRPHARRLYYPQRLLRRMGCAAP